jgi:BCCIP
MSSKKAKVSDSTKSKEVAAMPPRSDSEGDSEDTDSGEDDDLLLEGVLIRNPDVSDSDDESDENSDSCAKFSKEQADSQKRKRKKPATREPDITHVEFTFWDMKEKFFHGIKTLLHSSSTIYAPHSSSLADLMIENPSVGTVISTEGDEDGNVYGFASVLSINTNFKDSSIQYLKQICLNKCPSEHKDEMETVLSGKTKRQAGFLLHSRMVNLPLEICEILHQQLVLDMDWAVEHAEGGEDERKSLDFGAFIRLAPATPGDRGTVDYKYFDDEIFANNSEFRYTIDAPKSYGSDQKQICSVIVMTKTGHREAMKEIKRLVGS